MERLSLRMSTPGTRLETFSSWNHRETLDSHTALKTCQLMMSIMMTRWVTHNIAFQHHLFQTASDNVLALASFFDRYPEYKNRSFYITGESYGGVYVPTLTQALIAKIQDKTMSYVNFVGVAIGNGEMSEIQQINSAVSLLYWRGERGKTQYDALNQCCNASSQPLTYCDWTQYYYLDTAGNAWPKYNDGSLAAYCGNLVVQQGFLDVWTTDNDVYNTFQDCYAAPNTPPNMPPNEQQHRRAKRSALQPLSNSIPFVDQNTKINTMSTDANMGFSCYNGDATQSYLNLPDVRTAIHIPTGVPFWQDCNDPMNERYVQMHNDTTNVFEAILASKYPLKFLIYNGDAGRINTDNLFSLLRYGLPILGRRMVY